MTTYEKEMMELLNDGIDGEAKITYDGQEIVNGRVQYNPDYRLCRGMLDQMQETIKFDEIDKIPQHLYSSFVRLFSKVSCDSYQMMFWMIKVLAAYDTALSDARYKMEKAEQKYKEASKIVRETEKERRVKGEITARQYELEKLTQYISESRAELNGMTDEISQKKEELKPLRAERIALKDEIDSLTTERDNIASDISLLEACRGTLAVEVVNLKNEKEAIGSEIEALKNEKEAIGSKGETSHKVEDTVEYVDFSSEDLGGDLADTSDVSGVRLNLGYGDASGVYREHKEERSIKNRPSDDTLKVERLQEEIKGLRGELLTIKDKFKATSERLNKTEDERDALYNIKGKLEYNLELARDKIEKLEEAGKSLNGILYQREKAKAGVGIRKKTLDDAVVYKLFYKDLLTVNDIASKFGVSRQTVYRSLNRYTKRARSDKLSENLKI